MHEDLARVIQPQLNLNTTPELCIQEEEEEDIAVSCGMATRSSPFQLYTLTNLVGYNLLTWILDVLSSCLGNR